MSFGNAVAGGLGAFIQTRLMKQDKARRDKQDALTERLLALNTGVKKSEVTYGMPNATEMDSNGMKTRDFAGGKTTTFASQKDNTSNESSEYTSEGTLKKPKSKVLVTDLDDGKTIQFLAHGGTVGYYHGGMGGCPDRMSWQKDSFKK
tara:strand:- start:5681 stop:6124 length:444 start_codon:yes stop_codon:yes gene_type:complete